MITTKHKSNKRQRKKNENIVENHLTKITDRNKIKETGRYRVPRKQKIEWWY